jgi:hypothetical protein
MSNKKTASSIYKRRKRAPSMTVTIDPQVCLLEKKYWNEEEGGPRKWGTYTVWDCPCMECCANSVLLRIINRGEYFNKVSLGRTPIKCVAYGDDGIEDESVYIDWWENTGAYSNNGGRRNNSESCFDTMGESVWMKFIDHVEGWKRSSCGKVSIGETFRVS